MKRKRTRINNNVIRDFINDFYRIELQSNKRDGHIVKARIFYYYMCIKYSNDIVSAKQLALSINKKQHGTVLGFLERMEDLKDYDKVGFKKYQVLEDAFLEKFDPFKENKDFQIDSKDLLLLKIRVKRLKKINIKLHHKIKELKLKLGEAFLEKAS